MTPYLNDTLFSVVGGNTEMGGLLSWLLSLFR